MKVPADETPFSQELEQWLKGSQRKTLGHLFEVFGEKSFAIAFLLLLCVSALPLPTGGLTNIFELIAALICLQLIAGRSTIWLPRKWQKINIGRLLKGKATQKLISVIKWFEKYSRRRGSGILEVNAVRSLIGLVILIFIAGSFVAPPFSGLDTLPALGVVIISLSLILEDVIMLISGIIVGCIGIALTLAAGTAIYSGFTNLF